MFLLLLLKRKAEAAEGVCSLVRKRIENKYHSESRMPRTPQCVYGVEPFVTFNSATTFGGNES